MADGPIDASRGRRWRDPELRVAVVILYDKHGRRASLSAVKTKIPDRSVRSGIAKTASLRSNFRDSVDECLSLHDFVVQAGEIRMLFAPFDFRKTKGKVSERTTTGNVSH